MLWVNLHLLQLLKKFKDNPVIQPICLVCFYKQCLHKVLISTKKQNHLQYDKILYYNLLKISI